jgi:GTP-binding protein LepA
LFSGVRILAAKKSVLDISRTRNFCIIAHIDHGKSTLADRLLERTGTVTTREMREQLLDDLDLERQRGITIKAKAVTLRTELDGEEYELNLIDTPGHVDFQYEVSRSLTCCEGALLLVDAFQGIEAQTMANAYAAMEHDLKIIPVINKIDLAYARVDEVAEEMEQSLGIDPSEIVKCSGKAGLGIDELLRAIIERVPAPTGDPNGKLQAMVFDSHYDDYRGAITYVRLMSGRVTRGQKLQLARANATYEAVELGQFIPKRRSTETLVAGQVGYLICNIKSLADVHIGDTVVEFGPNAAEPLEGYMEPKRMVYCGLYPSDGQDFKELRDALEKLSINDPSFEFQPETSDALGFGFRCGFLGLLHMEIVQQRLEDECNVDLVQTAPNVTYQITTKHGDELEIHKPQDVPDAGDIEEFRQPIVRVNFVVPIEQIGVVMKLCQDRRGLQRGTEYISATRAMVTYDLPLAEVIYDLHDKLKSATRGYGTMDYELIGYEPANLVRMDIMVNGNRVDALSIICDRRDAERRGRAVVKKLKDEIDRHMFEIAVQAAIGSRIIARETKSALRKNVTAKCYGGDITRKRKLWAKQKEGKKRMKSIGSVDIPQKAFMAVLETGGEK